YLDKSLVLGNEIGNTDVLKSAYAALVELDSAVGNYQKAFADYKMYIVFRDSLTNAENKEKTLRMQMQYDFDKKEDSVRYQRELADAKFRQQVMSTQKQKQAKNYLLAALALFVILSFLIFRNYQNHRKLNRLYRISAEKQMAELQLQSLRAQLNPHFMFNSLNAIQELIVMEENERSQSYLERFAQLLRQLLDNANQPFIPLRKEISFLDHYLSLENLRLPDLKYAITIDPGVVVEKMMIPNMMLQPYIENALWHGLQHKQGMKQLQLHIGTQNDFLLFKISDNGVGRKKAEELKSIYRKEHRSKGMELLSERFSLLSKEYGQHIKTKITDLTQNGEPAGTLVEISVPVSISEQHKKQQDDTNDHN
ncbi:MAG TPA: histidine kinase, partial [Chitinophagaceae bacterium]|nr:histidine kinase [Chitinophagaceae bacterium]